MKRNGFIFHNEMPFSAAFFPSSKKKKRRRWRENCLIEISARDTCTHGARVAPVLAGSDWPSTTRPFDVKRTKYFISNALLTAASTLLSNRFHYTAPRRKRIPWRFTIEFDVETHLLIITIISCLHGGPICPVMLPPRGVLSCLLFKDTKIRSDFLPHHIYIYYYFLALEKQLSQRKQAQWGRSRPDINTELFLIWATTPPPIPVMCTRVADLNPVENIVGHETDWFDYSLVSINRKRRREVSK